MKLEIISATRLSEQDFWTKSALGISLRRLKSLGTVSANIAASNSLGLPQIYNERILAAPHDSVVVMIHDDVWIDDYHLRIRLAEALARYQIVGVAGNHVRLPGQAGWSFVRSADDRSGFSGAIAIGEGPFGRVQYFGAAPRECELLDGVFLAARRSVLAENGVLFDTRFDFHFYDVDFCRTARRQGLLLGTWPICLTHQKQVGEYGGKAWNSAYEAYIHKWGG